MKRVSAAFILPVIMIFTAAFACKMTSGSDTTSTTPAGNSAAPSTSGGTGSVSTTDDPKDVLLKAVKAQLAAKSFRMKMENVLSGTSKSDMTAEFVAPDRLHITTHSQLTGREINSETIVIGKDAWMKKDGGSWTKSPVDLSKMMDEMRNTKIEEQLSKVKDIHLVGPDTVDGMATLVYGYSVKDEDDEINVDVKAWVSVADGMLRKMEIGDPDDNTKQTATITDYDADLSIEAPPL